MAVRSIEVTVYKDQTLAACPDGSTRYIDCNVTKIKEVSIAQTVGGDNCRTWAAGDEFEPGMAPEGVDIVATVKLNTNMGFLWVSPASYDALKAECDACCIED